MDGFYKIMQAKHLASFEEYMLKVSDLGKRMTLFSTLLPQSAQESNNKAILKIWGPKVFESGGKQQDAVITVDFVKENGSWKIDSEKWTGQP